MSDCKIANSVVGEIISMDKISEVSGITLIISDGNGLNTKSDSNCLKTNSDLVIQSELESDPANQNSFTRQQWATLSVFAFVNICASFCNSIQAPFFPKESEAKGATHTEDGVVFASFQFTVLIMSPIFGKYMKKIGPKLAFYAGIAVTGISSLLFGLLTYVNDRTAFVVLAMIIRIIEAAGYSAGITSTFTLIAAGFPGSVGTVFAAMETFNGVGLIVGPMVGVWLYHFGGFMTPFAVVGCLLLLGSTFAYFVMPDMTQNASTLTTSSADAQKIESSNHSYFKILRIPTVAMAAFTIFAAAVSIGFNFPTIEPHIRSLNLGNFSTGLIFIAHGLVYALTAPIWGRMCDKLLDPRYVTVIGSVLIFIGIALIGPILILPFEKSFGLILLGLCFQGLGLGAALVAAFAQALRGALEFGYSEGIQTFGLVSGLWMAGFSLGNFVGPSLGGYLFDEFDGYANSSLFVLAVQLLVVVVFCWNSICKRHAKPEGDKLTNCKKISNDKVNAEFIEEDEECKPVGIV